VISHLLNWKHLRWTELTGIPHESQQQKSSKYDAFRSWSLNGTYANLVHHPPATLSARSVARCVVLGLGSLPTTSPTRDDKTHHIDRSVRDEMRVEIKWSMYHTSYVCLTCGPICSSNFTALSPTTFPPNMTWPGFELLQYIHTSFHKPAVTCYW